jgi:hypothetical protein
MRSRKLIPLFATLVALGFGSTAVADSPLWLHVRVDEGGGAKVAVNVPFSLITVALPMIDIDEHIHDNHIELNDHEISYEEMRALWQEVRQGPDMEFVTVEDDEESVRVWKEAGYLYVRVRDRHNERVDVKAPLEVVDALLSGDGNRFDVEGAMAALADQGEGELVTVQGDDETVRVWIDSSPEPGD